MDEMPFEVVVDGGKGEERESLIQNMSMDSWDDNEWDKKEEITEKIEQWRQSTTQKQTEPQESTEVDLFSTLEPTITTARKVVLGGQKRAQAHAPKRDLFALNETSVGATTTLGEIEDDLMGWGEDDLDSTLKEHRDEQVKQRQAEHERRLYEKRLKQHAVHEL